MRGFCRWSVALVCTMSVVLSAAGCSQSSKSQSASGKSGNWIELFDGKTTNGWHTAKQKSATNWAVKDGCITRTDAGGDLFTDATYDNFILELDWKISPGGNSGVFYRADESDSTPWVAPEIQVYDKPDQPFDDKHAAGACYDLYGPTVDARKPAGEWNHFRIVCDGPHVTHYFNGKKVCDYVIGSQDWNERVAKSKYAPHPNFSKLTKGSIVLQDHNSHVEYRNIRLKPL
jgi:hypothetical protein